MVYTLILQGYLVRIGGSGAWTGGQAVGGIGWRGSGGVEADEGRGQEVPLGGQTGRRLVLVVLESALSFSELCLEQVNFLNTDSHNTGPQNSMTLNFVHLHQNYLSRLRHRTDRPTPGNISAVLYTQTFNNLHAFH